jgi:hypothetical protein
VTDADWPGDAIIILALFWDQSTFADPDEPKLTVDRPGITPDSIIANANSTFGPGGTPKITINENLFTRILPQPGDYNVDGKVDAWDYLEWRKAYGTSNPCCDGNHDGIVDAGDYIVLEHAEAVRGQPVVSQISSVPEPACMALALVACFGLTGVRRKRSLCRNIV